RYPYLLDQILGSGRRCKNIAVVTDSITVNAIWYRSPADYFFVANEKSAAVVHNGGVPPEKIKVFGFPVSPRFADFTKDRPSPAAVVPRVICVMKAGPRRAPPLAPTLVELARQSTVTVGRDAKLRESTEAPAGRRETAR